LEQFEANIQKKERMSVEGDPAVHEKKRHKRLRVRGQAKIVEAVGEALRWKLKGQRRKKRARAVNLEGTGGWAAKRGLGAVGTCRFVPFPWLDRPWGWKKEREKEN
jgi:hypothetical protein